MYRKRADGVFYFMAGGLMQGELEVTEQEYLDYVNKVQLDKVQAMTNAQKKANEARVIIVEALTALPNVSADDVKNAFLWD